jgi:hypothetical protein
MEISEYMSTTIMGLKDRAIITIAVAVLATLFFCKVLSGDLVSTYGSFAGGGEGRSSEHVGSPGRGADIPTNNPSSPIAGGEGRLSGPGGFQGEDNNPNSLIASGDNFGSSSGSGLVGPHGPYGPGSTGLREPSNIDDNIVTKNNINTPRTLEGSVIVNQQPAPTTTTTTETPSQTDITVAPTIAQEEQQQDTSSDDSGGDKSTSTEDQNQIPVANAGPSLTVKPTANVALDGTNSYDPNGDILQFLWLQLAGGPPVSLLNNATATPSFTAPPVLNTATLTFQLIVGDGKSDSTPAYTYVTVQP